MTEDLDDKVTLTVAVIAHAEGRLLRNTLRSVVAAIGAVVENSVSCELLIVLDSATHATVAEANSWLRVGRVNAPVRIVQLNAGDAGASRNAAAQNARGIYLAHCDGDDLVSRNYFTTALQMLMESPESLIVHPAIVLSFGARALIWHIPASESIDHLELLRHNQWPSSSVSRRSIYMDMPYTEMDAPEGFGPEDWLWNMQTTIAGIAHRPAPDTIFFYRVRQHGGVNNRHVTSVLPAFDLDDLVRTLPIRPHQKTPRIDMTDVLRGVVRGAHSVALPAIRLFSYPLSQPTKERLFHRAHGDVWRTRKKKIRRSVTSAIITALREAAELEPALSWTVNAFGGLPEWNPPTDIYSELLISLFGELRDRADAIVAVPWVGIGGADLVSLNYARALVAQPRFGGKVTMLATYEPKRTLRHLVPNGVNFVQVPVVFRELAPDLQRRLLAQLLVLLQPKLVLSVNCFDVTNSLQLYGPQLATVSPTYLTLFAFDRIGGGYPVNPITDDSQRRYLDDIAGIVTDNTVTAGLVQEMLALSDDKVLVHHQPAMNELPELAITTRAYSDTNFSSENPFKVLWPHRLDKEKRPDALIEIAKRLRSEGLPVQVDVYGQQVLSQGGKELMRSMAAAGIQYKGPYSGGLVALPTHDYHALLLTSESEGLPLVLVQSMLLGLPVIASAVGGVVDIVRDGKTGILAQGPEDIDGFVDGIRRLMVSVDNRRHIIHTAYDLSVAQHGWTTFTHLVDQLG